MVSTRDLVRPAPWVAVFLLAAVAACDDHTTVPTTEPEGPGPLSVAPALLPDDVDTCGENTRVSLVAGQHTDIGTVTVANDEDNVYVTFATGTGWTLRATHLEVATSLGDVPVNGAGNPVMGHFTWQQTHADGTKRFTVTIPRSELGVEVGDELIVAAHADVYDTDSERSEGAWGEGTRFVENGGNWATHFSFTVQGCIVVLGPDELCSDHGDDAIATFADPDLEQLVRRQGQIFTREITCEQLEGVKGLGSNRALDSTEPEITDLSGIQNLPDLTHVLFFDHAISDLAPLASLTKLERVLFSENSVSDLGPLSGLTNLEILSVQRNSIADVSPLSGLTGLKTLRLSVNAISDISPLSGLTELTGLSLSRNRITDIGPVAGLTKLTDLALSGNRGITDFTPVSGLTDLTSLALGGTSISDLSPLSTLTRLETLTLNGNSIANLGPLSGLTALELLFLNANEISDVTPLTGLTNLTWLRLTANPALADVQPLIDNTGLGAGDKVNVQNTAVTCDEVADLRAEGVTVLTNCLGDSDGDGYDARTDCDDTDADVYPGADEVPDGVDNDCDGLVDEGA